MKTFSLISILFFSSFAHCGAQKINTVFNQFNFENGLSSNEIRCLAQDEEGFLWVGTTKGLNRYDGNSFVQYFMSVNGLAANNIHDLLSLGRNRIAIATVNGLKFFDTRHNTFTVFRARDTSVLADFSNNFLKLCIDEQKHLWAFTQTELYLFDSSLHLIKTFSSGYTAKDINTKRIAFVWNISALPGDKILIQFYDHSSIYDLDNGSLDVIKPSSTSKWAFVSKGDFTPVFLADRYKRFWFVKQKKDSIYEFNIADNSLRSLPLFRGASVYFTYTAAIFCVDSNHLILEFPHLGFYQLSFTKNLSVITHFKNLPVISDVPSFLSDNQNNFWIGTRSGLYYYCALKNQFDTVRLQARKLNSPDADVMYIKQSDKNYG